MANGTEEDVVLAAARVGPADNFEEPYPEISDEDSEEELKEILSKLSKGATIGLSKLVAALVDPKLDAEAAEREATRIRGQLVAALSKFLREF